MKDCYCILADIGLSTHNTGTVSICNQNRSCFSAENGRPMTLDKYSLEEAWNSESRQSIRNDLKNGIQHPSCQQCWDEESCGRESKRLASNKLYESVVPREDQPLVMMLKPGNTCNLKCRHCNPQTSSAWVKDYMAVEETDQQFLDILELSAASYHRSNPMWNTLEQWLLNAVYVELYGAEPFLIKPLWTIMKTASESDNAQNLTVYINTNGTIWSDDHAEILKKFKKTEVSVSIDGVAEQFEYMRHPAQWDSTLSNLKELMKIPNIFVSVTITLSALNIYYALDTLFFFEKRGIPAGFNILFGPSHLNFRILPDVVKDAVAKRLRSQSDYHTYLVDLLNSDINEREENFKKFLSTTLAYDKLREENYQEVFPEMSELLLPYIKDLEV